MRLSVRRHVRQRDGFACAYCGVTENEVGSELTIDHFQPLVAAGDNSEENLLYCCFACNIFKGDYWNPNAVERILHPYQDRVAEHIQEADDGLLIGLTPTGIFHIDRLHLNRPALLAHRLIRRREFQADQERQALLAELMQTQQQLTALLARFDIPAESEETS